MNCVCTTLYAHNDNDNGKKKKKVGRWKSIFTHTYMNQIVNRQQRQKMDTAHEIVSEEKNTHTQYDCDRSNTIHMWGVLTQTLTPNLLQYYYYYFFLPKKRLYGWSHRIR